MIVHIKVQFLSFQMIKTITITKWKPLQDGHSKYFERRLGWRLATGRGGQSWSSGWQGELQTKKSKFLYFEANEGKNASDIISSIIKCASIKCITKVNLRIGNSLDMHELVKGNLKTKMKKFDFFIVAEFPFIEQIEKRDSEFFQIHWISKVHLFVKDEGIIAK